MESGKIMCTQNQNQIYVCGSLSKELLLPHLNYDCNFSLSIDCIHISNAVKYRGRNKSVNTTNGLLYTPGSQYIVAGGKAARNA